MVHTRDQTATITPSNDLLPVSTLHSQVLDIPRTLEYLETQGVCVAAYGTDEFPAFFTPHRYDRCRVHVLREIGWIGNALGPMHWAHHRIDVPISFRTGAARMWAAAWCMHLRVDGLIRFGTCLPN